MWMSWVKELSELQSVLSLKWLPVPGEKLNIPACIPMARQCPQHTCGQQYGNSVFFICGWANAMKQPRCDVTQQYVTFMWHVSYVMCHNDIIDTWMMQQYCWSQHFSAIPFETTRWEPQWTKTSSWISGGTEYRRIQEVSLWRICIWIRRLYDCCGAVNYKVCVNQQ
jgi:hypothetical protein